MNVGGKVTSKEGFLSLLRALSESESTGALVAADGDIERRLFFEDGAIVATASSAHRDSFGHFLVQRAIIHERTLSNVEEHQNENSALFGQTLVDLGVMTEIEVENALRLNIKKTILDIYSGRGKFTLVNERLGEQRRVNVSVDARELIAKDIEVELGDGPTPMVVAKTPVSKPPIREDNAPSYTPPSPPIEVGEVRRSSPASGGGDKQTDLSDAIAQSVQWTTDSHRDPLRYLLLAVTCIIAGLALSVFILWLLSTDEKPRNVHRAPAREADAKVEASIPREPPDTPLTTEPAAVVTEQMVTPPTFQPTRTKVEATSEKPASPVSRTKPVRSQPAKTEQEPAVELPTVASPLVETDVETIAPPPASLPVAEVSSDPAGGVENAVVEPSPIEPPVQPGDLVEPASDVIDPVLLEMPKLHYPKDAKRHKVEAVVRVRVLVDENGKVLKAELEEFVGHGFDEAALSVAVRTQFIPATKGTVPVKMWTTFPIVYRLEKK